MLVHAYATSPGKAKWSGPYQWREENEFKFHSLTCYTNSIILLIHVNTIKLRNITCTLVATCVILQSLECIAPPSCTHNHPCHNMNVWMYFNTFEKATKPLKNLNTWGCDHMTYYCIRRYERIVTMIEELNNFMGQGPQV